jgi:gamma-glutamyl-gamma-aminobutyrate hydrolase PuuD
MKPIAITARLIANTSYPETQEALDIRWGALFQQAGLLPVLLALQFESLDSLFERFQLQGVLFTGGNDLGRVSDSSLSHQRDDFEKKILSIAIELKIPVLGVCRGAQLIADYFGAEFRPVEGHIDTKHRIIPNPKSRYYSQLNKRESVNSYHNFAIHSLCSDLVVSAKDQEENIEAFEHSTLPIFGQMWHPEREVPFLVEDIKLINKVFS